MTPKALAKVRDKLESMLRSPRGLKSRDLESIAQKLGRTRAKRGSEPTWVREDQPLLTPPLSIPHHSADMPPGTAKSVIEALLSDADEWDLFLIENPPEDKE